MNYIFLSGTHTIIPMCVPGHDGDKFIDDQDQIICENYYSAFTNTSLANVLNAIHEVHVCGRTTNCCVRAIVTDAFFHGHEVFIWTDYLGYRCQKKIQ